LAVKPPSTPSGGVDKALMGIFYIFLIDKIYIKNYTAYKQLGLPKIH